MEGFATIATWDVSTTKGDVHWELLYPITRDAWFRTAMSGPEQGHDDWAFGDRLIAVDLLMLRGEPRSARLRVQYNLQSEEMRAWFEFGIVEPTTGDVAVLASMWIDVLRQNPDSPALHDITGHRIPMVNLSQYVPTHMKTERERITNKLIEAANQAHPQFHVDVSSYRLLDVNPPFLWNFDAMTKWYQKQDP